MTLVGNAITEILKDPFGLTLQVLTVIIGLTDAYLLSKKGLERWGYLLAFVSLPLWVVLEWWYKEWFYFILNPIYFIVWGIGLKNHWRRTT